jgi:hypothetical protein
MLLKTKPPVSIIPSRTSSCKCFSRIAALDKQSNWRKDVKREGTFLTSKCLGFSKLRRRNSITKDHPLKAEASLVILALQREILAATKSKIWLSIYT